MSRVAQRVEEWKRKIVDLSRRNRLLFFVRTRGSTLKIIEPGLPETFSRLVNLEKPWEFFMPPDDEDTQQAADGSTNTELLPSTGLFPENPNTTVEKGAEVRLRRRADELLTDIREGTQLRSILRNLYRRSRTDFEERGVRILFLAFGVLEWKEVEQSEVVRSPILLIPVELKRVSINDPFELCPVGEEIVINPALAVKLAEDFEVQLPAVPEDWESVSLGEFLAQFQVQTGKYNWSLKEECWLGLFSFHKLVIYKT